MVHVLDFAPTSETSFRFMEKFGLCDFIYILIYFSKTHDDHKKDIKIDVGHEGIL